MDLNETRKQNEKREIFSVEAQHGVTEDNENEENTNNTAIDGEFVSAEEDNFYCSAVTDDGDLIGFDAQEKSIVPGKPKSKKKGSQEGQGSNTIH